MWFGSHCVCACVVVVALTAMVVVGQVRLQSSEKPAGVLQGTPPQFTSPPHPWFINGPTGFSVEGEHHRVAGVRDFINGPTGTSVDRQEDRPRGTYISGPSQTSLFTEERKADEAEEALRAQLENSTNDQEAVPDNATVTEEPTIATVDGGGVGGAGEGEDVVTEVQQGEEDGTLKDERSGTEGELLQQEEEARGTMRSAGRGIINTHPDEGIDDTQILPPGLHIDTTDGSRDTSDWMYAGGEWARMNLPDPAHPGIPAPTLPSPAYVVVTKEYLKKVTMKREFRRMTNLSLHYSFFLSQGEAPPGEPELEVYHVVNDTTTQLAKETSRGAWSDRTIRVPDTSNTFSIVFLARRMTEGNEIALDDITTSGTSLGDPVSSSDIPELQEPEDMTMHDQDTAMQTHDTENATQLLDDDTFTDNQTSITLYGINGTTKGEEKITLPPDVGTVEGEEMEETEPSDGHTTIGKSVSLGVSPSPILETNMTTEDNQTQNTEDATSFVTTIGPTDGNETNSARPHTLDNMTQSVSTISNVMTDSDNSTFDTLQPQPSGGEGLSSLPSTDPLNNTTATTRDSDDTSDTVPLNSNLTATSGSVTPPINTTIAPTNTTSIIDGPMTNESSTTSWRVFQVFLVLCAIGILGLGFLYWKRKRRQEDEIPVFTRPSHTDYHNPTFNMDDDASFVSRGGTHNYKSFD